jgi:hypothetical protein
VSSTLKSRVEDSIEGHSEDVHVKQSMLDETYNRLTRVDRTNESVRTAASGACPRPCSCMKAGVPQEDLG